ncbi:MAG: 1-acyl-sn-glycerol-3-phosphate acyltransferase [Actinomycetota bacterium]|nr:1-acyl-sn-glycerol-3-phosphate acyltransferase [Actinomycetota bacterium]MDQ1505519.1 1-acyl-sn-glycerol-3-phosphate acyltransferase [Actinomycetota bacterium]
MTDATPSPPPEAAPGPPPESPPPDAMPASPPAPSGASSPAPTAPGRGELAAYWFVRALVAGVCTLLWRIRIVHPERVPVTGACVLAPSHRSFLDTPFLACVTKRRIRFMGKAELWKYGWSAKFFSALGGFPVDRDGPDRAAMRAAEAALAGGEPLGMFPEGTRRSGPVVEDLHHGVAFVAARMGVPIVPIGIGGSERILARGRKLPKLSRVVVVVGEPIQPPARAAGASVRRGDVAALTEQLQEAVQHLFDEAEAATLAR